MGLASVVFCYDEEDKSSVEDLANKTIHEGVTTRLVARKDLEPDPDSVLGRGPMKSQDIVTIVLGRRGLEPWQPAGVATWFQGRVVEGARIFPLYLPDTDRATGALWYLRGLQAFDLRDGAEQGLTDLIRLADEEPLDVYFGYFFTVEKGRERVLVRHDSDGRPHFPIFGIRDGDSSVEDAVGSAVEGFARHLPNDGDSILASILDPRVFDVSSASGDLGTLNIQGRNRTIRPFFFKVAATTDAEIGNDAFAWRDKREFFRNWLWDPHEIPKGAERKKADSNTSRLLEAASRDKVTVSFGRRMLECVDVIVFRERQGEYEFLMLRRKDGKDRWEYPKGGIEYHETVHEGAIRELLEETGLQATGGFRYGGELGSQVADVSSRGKPYDHLHVHGVTYMYYGPDSLELGRSDEHWNEYKWVPWETAREKIWVGQYGQRFFDTWHKRRWRIKRDVARPISLAFQISEECPLGCRFCLRRQEGEEDLSLEERKDVIDLLAERGILRLTITGGEPLLNPKKKEDAFQLVEYAHAKRIHTCLSTTGTRIDEGDIDRLEACLDQLLLSIHSREPKIAPRLYENAKTWEHLNTKAEDILNWTRGKKLIIEISTVASRINYEHIPDLGAWLFGLRDDIFWRVDEYYPNGAQDPRDNPFGLKKEEFDDLASRLSKQFSKKLDTRQIRFSRKDTRVVAPDIMITPQGMMVTSSDNEYELKGQGQRSDLMFTELKNRREWSEYRDCIRTDWEW